MKELIINDVADVFIKNKSGDDIKMFENVQPVSTISEYELNLQPLNNMLRDFSYRTVVKIVDASDGEKLFKGTVGKYHQSDLKQKELLIELAEVFDGEFVIQVR